jgi:hypothetical protein
MFHISICKSDSKHIRMLIYIQNTIIWIRGFGHYYINPGPSTGLLISLYQESLATDEVKKRTSTGKPEGT